MVGRLATTLRWHRLPVLYNICKGDMSFIGPRLVTPDEFNLRTVQARKRYTMRPGLFCLWWIRQRANIAYGSEIEADNEYVDTQNMWGDCGIALRAIPAILYGEGIANAPDVVTMLGVPIHNLTMDEAVATIQERLDRPTPSHVCFVNADCLNIASHDPGYHTVLVQADVVLPDGIGLKLAGKCLGQEIKQNVNGTDLFPRLCGALSGTLKRLFLLGARPGIPEAVADWIAGHYPDVQVAGWHHGYFEPSEESRVLQQIARSKADVLLVALGAPRQDVWIRQHLYATGAKVAIGVGGLFDFYSGRMPRAPMWMREIGAEWMYRFYQEPGRMWKRYLIGNGRFLWRVLRSRSRQEAVPQPDSYPHKETIP
jgi:N-acetylglucosaminyldiphosphoundecaprenol N-acetyl-beta-D-mannosaminyltransferase